MRILFVCSENSRRSQMAEALATMLGAEGVEAFSAGAEPVGYVDPQAIEVMRELGYDMSAHEPKSLDEVPHIEFDYLITMGCADDAPVVKARMQIDWDVPDPAGMGVSEFRNVREMLRERIQRLLVAPRLASS